MERRRFGARTVLALLLGIPLTVASTSRQHGGRQHGGRQHGGRRQPPGPRRGSRPPLRPLLRDLDERQAARRGPRLRRPRPDPRPSCRLPGRGRAQVGLERQPAPDRPARRPLRPPGPRTARHGRGRGPVVRRVQRRPGRHGDRRLVPERAADRPGVRVRGDHLRRDPPRHGRGGQLAEQHGRDRPAQRGDRADCRTGAARAHRTGPDHVHPASSRGACPPTAWPC